MDPRLLRYYNSELQHVREVGGEFAAEFPKIAGRLGMDGFDCADPYVERLLEGFAFLAARVQLKIDAEFPRFTQHLLEMVYPNYLGPTPSMTVAEFSPNLSEGSLADGFTLERGTQLRSLLGKDDQTACTFQTSHDVTMWPLELTEAEYFSRDVATLELPRIPNVRAGVRLRFRFTAGVTCEKVDLNDLDLFLRGGGDRSMHLYEQMLADTVAVVVRPKPPKPAWHEILDQSCVQRLGFDDDHALLPYGIRSFHGYRLLHEYFAFPQRYMFVKLTGLNHALRRFGEKENEFEVIVLLSKIDNLLENNIAADDFKLNCAPAINLFSKRTDRIHLTDGRYEHHIVPDRTRPLDFEVYSVSSVRGYGTAAESEREFLPFYASRDLTEANDEGAYFSVRREPRVVSSKQRRDGPRSSYVSGESFLALVDANETPYRHDLRQLGMTVMCTNRDLPLFMPVGKSTTDFTLDVSAPVKSIRCVAGPTKPRSSPFFHSGDNVWRLINHLSLNYLSLVDSGEHEGAAAMRELLRLYSDMSEPATVKQIDGVRFISSDPIIRPIPTSGPMTFGRGLQINVTFDEAAFEGTGAFLLGAVLEQFFAKYVSINSFTETVVNTVDRDEIMRWPLRIGRRHVL